MNKTRVIVALIPLLVLTACANKGEAPLQVAADAGTSAPQLQWAADPAPQRSRTLAYEHTVSVELSKDLLPARMQALQDACNSDREHGCTILDAETSSNSDVPRGSVRMRLAPGGVDTLIALAGKDGRVIGRTTHAEDLAEPVADTQRELALLTTHRNRLEELLKSKELKIDQLITVSKELATVQTQIDTLGTRAANLQRRIDTELLTIMLTVPRQDYQAASTPIRDAVGSFGSEFRQAIAEVIGFLAWLLPWLVILIPGFILLRLLWRWISRWLNRREAKAAT